MKFIPLLALLLIVIGCSAESIQKDTPTTIDLPESAAYTLNSEQSQLIYQASRFVGSSHVGTVAINAGELERENDKFTSGKFVIDMTTITEEKNNERYLKHVRSDDFFGIEKYPTAQFVITKIEESEQYTITGDLTIRDQTHEITFPAEIVSADENSLEINAAFTIDRTKWGITFDSSSFFTTIGDKAIKDDVRFGLKLMFEKE